MYVSTVIYLSLYLSLFIVLSFLPMHYNRRIQPKHVSESIFYQNVTFKGSFFEKKNWLSNSIILKHLTILIFPIYVLFLCFFLDELRETEGHILQVLQGTFKEKPHKILIAIKLHTISLQRNEQVFRPIGP